jgi:NAD(P)-dependent dehydrogenase (short-subunit alcohol dehydrogenase family)
MGKTALITGGSSGLGLAYAEILGQQGYRIIILARNPERIELAVQSLSEKGIRADGISVDVTDDMQMAEATRQVRMLSISLDFLILNAGEVTPRLLCDYASAPELKKDIDIDLWGIMLSAWSFIPFLGNGSKILMTSSGFGLMGAAGYAPYCAAKAGIINFAESLRRELLFRKIGVYAACPGDLDTPQFANEIAGQPVWMKEQSSPRQVIPASLAAQRILDKCKGHSRLLILPDPSVKLLNIVLKIFPRSWSRLLIDKMFPRPH